jgi:HD-GYP domain-containing protein (c-di-GMP phosphodiesterase class II)
MTEGFNVYIAAPLMAKGQVVGVMELFNREPLEIDYEWRDFLDTLAGQAAIAIDNAALFKARQQSSIELLVAYDLTLEGWSKALDLRDRETEGHSLRVTEGTERLARYMNYSPGEITHMRRGALLHDIGKLGIPDGILLKPGSLSNEEWAVMRLHPSYAYEWLSPIPFLKPALEIPYSHHERWDGSGYPRKLVGEEIPIAARIFAVIDVWDALTSDRPYRRAWSEEQSINYLKENSGILFDPKVIEAFISMNSELAFFENAAK